MVKYCMNLSDEKKETAIKIALESKGNVRKRKIAVPLLMILGIVIIFSSIFLIINSPAILWYIYMVLGIVCLLLAFNAKSFQKFVLKKAELLLDKSFRTGIVEYHFDAEGIENTFGKVSGALSLWKERLNDIRRKPGNYTLNGIHDWANRRTADLNGRNDSGNAEPGHSTLSYAKTESEIMFIISAV